MGENGQRQTGSHHRLFAQRLVAPHDRKGNVGGAKRLRQEKAQHPVGVWSHDRDVARGHALGNLLDDPLGYGLDHLPSVAGLHYIRHGLPRRPARGSVGCLAQLRTNAVGKGHHIPVGTCPRHHGDRLRTLLL